MRTSVTSAIHVAVFISVTVHAVVLVELGARYVSTPPTSEPTPGPVHRVVLATETVPPARAPSPPQTERDVPPAPEQQPNPPPPPLPVEPKPVKPSPQAPAQQQRPRANPPPSPPRAEPPPPAATPPFKPAARPAPVPSAQVREDYIERVLRRIERHKAYPPLARRRRISGDVILALRIRADGTLQSVNCTQGHALLCRAAVDASRSAGPYPPLPEAVETLAVDYRMVFSLR